MTWTYTWQFTGRDKVRQLVGDTNSDDQILQDQEIDGVLAVYSNETEAAAHICLNLAAQFAIEGDVDHDRYHFKGLDQSKRYLEMSERYFKMSIGSNAPMALAAPLYGGISKAAKESNELNTDNVSPKFYRSQFQDQELESEDDDTN